MAGRKRRAASAAAEKKSGRGASPAAAASARAARKPRSPASARQQRAGVRALPSDAARLTAETATARPRRSAPPKTFASAAVEASSASTSGGDPVESAGRRTPRRSEREARLSTSRSEELEGGAVIGTATLSTRRSPRTRTTPAVAEPDASSAALSTRRSGTKRPHVTSTSTPRTPARMSVAERGEVEEEADRAGGTPAQPARRSSRARPSSTKAPAASRGGAEGGGRQRRCSTRFEPKKPSENRVDGNGGGDEESTGARSRYPRCAAAAVREKYAEESDEDIVSDDDDRDDDIDANENDERERNVDVVDVDPDDADELNSDDDHEQLEFQQKKTAIRKRSREDESNRTCPDCGKVLASAAGLQKHQQDMVCADPHELLECCYGRLDPGEKFITLYGVAEVVSDSRLSFVSRCGSVGDLRQEAINRARSLTGGGTGKSSRRKREAEARKVLKLRAQSRYVKSRTVSERRRAFLSESWRVRRSRESGDGTAGADGSSFPAQREVWKAYGFRGEKVPRPLWPGEGAIRATRWKRLLDSGGGNDDGGGTDEGEENNVADEEFIPHPDRIVSCVLVPDERRKITSVDAPKPREGSLETEVEARRRERASEKIAVSPPPSRLYLRRALLSTPYDAERPHCSCHLCGAILSTRRSLVRHLSFRGARCNSRFRAPWESLVVDRTTTDERKMPPRSTSLSPWPQKKRKWVNPSVVLGKLPASERPPFLLAPPGTGTTIKGAPRKNARYAEHGPKPWLTDTKKAMRPSWLEFRPATSCWYIEVYKTLAFKRGANNTKWVTRQREKSRFVAKKSASERRHWHRTQKAVEGKAMYPQLTKTLGLLRKVEESAVYANIYEMLGFQRGKRNQAVFHPVGRKIKRVAGTALSDPAIVGDEDCHYETHKTFAKRSDKLLKSDAKFLQGASSRQDEQGSLKFVAKQSGTGDVQAETLEGSHTEEELRQLISDYSAALPANSKRKKNFDALSAHDKTAYVASRMYVTNRPQQKCRRHWNKLWNDRLVELQEYKRRHRTFSIKRRESSVLYNWAFEQRRQYGLRERGEPNNLSDDRFRALEACGFDWVSEAKIVADSTKKGPELWNHRLAELRDYRRCHGTYSVDRRESSPLYNWVLHQRKQYRLRECGEPNTISDERVQALESIGFDLKKRRKRVGKAKSEDKGFSANCESEEEGGDGATEAAEPTKKRPRGSLRNEKETGEDAPEATETASASARPPSSSSEILTGTAMAVSTSNEIVQLNHATEKAAQSSGMINCPICSEGYTHDHTPGNKEDRRPVSFPCCGNTVCTTCAETHRAAKIQELTGRRKTIQCISAICDVKFHSERTKFPLSKKHIHFVRLVASNAREKVTGTKSEGGGGHIVVAQSSRMEEEIFGTSEDKAQRQGRSSKSDVTLLPPILPQKDLENIW